MDSELQHPILLWLAELVAVLAFCSVAGVAADRFMLRRHKSRLYGVVETWWIRLDESSFPELHKPTAQTAIAGMQWALGRKRTAFRSISAIAILSLTLTFLTLFLGQVYGFKIGLPSAGYPTAGDMTITQIITVSIFGMTYDWYVILYCIIILPIMNMLFDFSTVIVTLYCLDKIKKVSALWAISFVAMDMFLDLAFVILCFWLALAVSKVIPISLYGEGLSLSPGNVWAVWIDSLRFPQNSSVAFFALTALMPTVLYIGILAIMIICKLILDGAKGVFLYYFELATDMTVEKFAPFTLLGIACGLIASLGRVVIEFAK